jgi:uncharacterized integral membrane protein
MISLILLLVFGSGLVYLSLQNTTTVTLTFLQYSLENIPLYYVIIGSVMLGVILAYLIHLISAISLAMTMRGKDKVIKEDKKEIIEMTKKVHVLQLENAGLQKDNNPESIDTKSL